jgi:hypothetical protein
MLDLGSAVQLLAADNLASPESRNEKALKIQGFDVSDMAEA